MRSTGVARLVWLGKTSRAECSVAHNKMCEGVARKMTLKIPEEDKEFRLYVDADERGMSVVVAQELEGKDWPVAFLSRLLR